MKCPLFSEHWEADFDGVNFLMERECWGKECAWWDSEERCCVVLSIARRLKQVQVSVAR